jgi:hypothetical protein
VAVKDLTEFVDEPIMASVLVLGPGSVDAMRARDRRGLGRGLRSERRSTAEYREHSPLRTTSTGLTGGLLLLTADELVLIAVRARLVGHLATDVIGRRELEQIDTVTFDAEGGRLRIAFLDHPRWEFDVLRRYRADAQVLAAMLQGAA